MKRSLFPSKFAAQPEKEDEKDMSLLYQLPLSLKVLTIYPAYIMIFALILKAISPVVFFVIPSWRSLHSDYGVSGGDNSQASLRPALAIFYTLVWTQGFLGIYVGSISLISGRQIFTQLQGRCNFPKEWARKALRRYMWDTVDKCKRDPAFIQNMNLFLHASQLVSSDSWEDYNDGLKVVAALVKQGFQVSGKYILPCRPTVQKLIDTLGFRSSNDEGVRHMREFAATIVADFANDLHLINFPGAIRCISSLLETTHEGVGVTSNELILQGLKILEKLAFDHHSCEVICRAPGLLSKIMEPVYSNTLIQETMALPRASVVNGSFKVVHRLIRNPGEAGTTLRCEISSSKQAVSNLERIIQDGTADNQEVQRILEDYKIIVRQEKKRILVTRQELKILAMKILTELALDSSTNLSTDTLGSFIMNQLEIFLADGGQQEAVTELISECPLKTTSGKTLALLSKSKDYSCIISKCGDIFYRLIQKFDDSSMVHRTTAAEILENLCTHHTLEVEFLKETLLPEVLGAILTGERKLKIEEAQSRTYAPGHDEENQNGKKQLTKSKQNMDQSVVNEGDEMQTDLKSLQEALLSLLLRINNLIGADSVALVVQEKAPGEGAFVSYLKTIVEENYEDITPTSLRIVKLCGQIAMSMVQHNLYTAHFKKQKFVQSLSTASDNMSELESCMLVTGTNYPMKPVRPLLSAVVSDLEKRLTEAFMPVS